MDPADNVLYCLEENKYYKSILVPGDGSCLFHLISFSLFGTMLFLQDIWSQCCAYMQANKEHLLQFLDLSSEELESRIRRLSDPNEYADHIEICMISIMYKVDVCIYQESLYNAIKRVFHEQVPDSQDVVKLLYVNGNHYMPLIDANISHDLPSLSVPIRIFKKWDINHEVEFTSTVELDHSYNRTEPIVPFTSEQFKQNF